MIKKYMVMILTDHDRIFCECSADETPGNILRRNGIEIMPNDDWYPEPNWKKEREHPTKRTHNYFDSAVSFCGKLLTMQESEEMVISELIPEDVRGDFTDYLRLSMLGNYGIWP